MPGGGRPRRNVTSKYMAPVDQDEEEEEHVAADPCEDKDEDEELEVEPSTSRGGQRTSHVDEEAAVRGGPARGDDNDDR